MLDDSSARTGRRTLRAGSGFWNSLTLIFTCLLPIIVASNDFASISMIPPSRVNLTHSLDQATGNASQLECLEVVPPVISLSPSVTSCTQTLMQYSFQNSYGQPFVGQYQPPSCSFSRVIMNLTVTSAGRQFDRLALMYFGDIEVFRTSTAEPTAAGIIWTYLKDMSVFLTLWKRPQTIIFDLGNIINENYTGAFNTILTATFYNDEQLNSTVPADNIIPISARKSATGGASAFMVPDTQAVNNFSIPQNAKRAVVSLSACGQMAEEFWWSNVPDSTVSTFGNDSLLLGHSPFREVQVLIDGQLAGVAWPFPMIFTGGVVPGFWRPVVGIDAFDLREDEIDITPWLPVLSDGREHSYEIRVMGLTDDGKGNAVLSTVGSYWVVTGKMFLWLDSTNTTTSGSAPTISNTDPQFFITSTTSTSTNGTNSTLNYQVLAQRQFSVSNMLTTSKGEQQVSWTQILSYTNTGLFVANGNNQTNTMTISGADASSIGYSRKFSYPLTVFNAFIVNEETGGMSIDGTMDRAKNVQVEGASAFPSPLDAFTSQGPFAGWTVTNRQNGSASYLSDPSTGSSASSGTTEQNYVLQGLINTKTKAPQSAMGGNSVQLYARHVLAANNSIVADSNPGSSTASGAGAGAGASDVAMMSEFAMLTAGDVVGGKIIGRGGTGKV